MKIRYYISGHGLGHASRSCQVISTLRRSYPDIAIEVSSPAHRWFLDNMLGDVPLISTTAWDLGVVQHDSLQLDLPATLAAARALYDQRDALVAAEAAELHAAGVALVVCDIPALPLAAASAAGIPSVAIGNFDWAWIYRGLAQQNPGIGDELQALAARLAEDYRHAGLMLRLPLASPCDCFERIEDAPMVARCARTPRGEIRRRLGIPENRRLGLLSFGGYGLRDLDLSPLALLEDWIFLSERNDYPHLPNLVRLTTGDYYYPDLVAAADAVITKPGYGIVTEAIANRTAVLYTLRSDFPEEPLLVEGLKRYTRCREISNEMLRCGDWGRPLAELLEMPPPAAIVATDGADAVAQRLATLAVGTA